jgi:hypothetical protein
MRLSGFLRLCIWGEVLFFHFCAGRAGFVPGLEERIRTASQSGRPVRVSQAVSKALLVDNLEPDCPEDARKEPIQGTVLLPAEIGTDPSNASSCVPASPRSRRRQWKYKPHCLLWKRRFG